jgi:FkbM family methyltransferase
MSLGYRAKRLAKEALGLRQWPKREAIRPENFEQQAYSALLELGDVCFDVGANVGDVAMYLARVVGPIGCVVAFEPVFSMYRQMCWNLQQDSYEKAPIVTIPMGLSNKAGPATISIPANNFFRGSLAPPEQWQRVQAVTEMSTNECCFTTLDAVLAGKQYPTPDFLKIDVEGAELLVLGGAVSAFENGFRPLMLIELFAPWEKAFGYGPWNVLSYLMSHEYRFLFACPSGLVEHEPSAETPVPSEYEQGDTVVAFVPERHGGRLARVHELRRDGRGSILPMAVPPLPNRTD